MIGTELKRKIGSIVTIEFRDGEILDAKVSSVDLDEHEDVVYEVIRVRESIRSVEYCPDNFYRASLADIVRVSEPAE